MMPLSTGARRLIWLAYFLGFAQLVQSMMGGFDFPGAKWIAISLVLIPSIEYSLFGHVELGERKVLSSVMGALLPLSFIYYVRSGYPVGFSDVHFHMFETENLFGSEGKIDFARAQAVSYTFVALYIQARMA